MAIVDKIIAFENGDLNQKQTIEFFKELYISKTLNGLQGTYQRTFNNLVENGLIDIKELQTEQKI